MEALVIDAEVVDRVVGELTANADRYDYASNVLERTYPRGLDVEAFSMWSMEESDRLAKSPASREHVTLGGQEGERLVVGIEHQDPGRQLHSRRGVDADRCDGTWGDVPVAADTQHVDGTYAGGDGDGSATRPWPTIAEGIALQLVLPALLEKNKCFMLAGSRRGDRRVPALWISDRAPKLGWCWEGNPHSWLGTASALGRRA